MYATGLTATPRLFVQYPDYNRTTFRSELGLAVDAPIMRETPAEAPTRVHVRPARHFAASAAELERHAAFVQGLEEPLWGVTAAA